VTIGHVPGALSILGNGSDLPPTPLMIRTALARSVEGESFVLCGQLAAWHCEELAIAFELYIHSRSNWKDEARE